MQKKVQGQTNSFAPHCQRIKTKFQTSPSKPKDKWYGWKNSKYPQNFWNRPMIIFIFSFLVSARRTSIEYESHKNKYCPQFFLLLQCWFLNMNLSRFLQHNWMISHFAHLRPAFELTFIYIFVEYIWSYFASLYQSLHNTFK